MKHLLPLKFLALLLALIGATYFLRAEDIKTIHPTGYVTDLAGVITPDTKTQLGALCTEVEQKTGAQMAIVTVHSIEGQSIEDYAADLYKQLGIGGKQDNRGVLILVAPVERQARVEVGYGLEPVITDGRAGQAGDAMVPLLRQSNYNGAVEAAAWQLANYIAADRGVTLSAQPPASATPPSSDGSGSSGIWIFLGILLILFLISRAGAGRRGGFLGGAAWWILPMLMGGGGGGSGWSGGGFGGSGGGFGGFGGGMSGGGGASRSW